MKEEKQHRILRGNPQIDKSVAKPSFTRTSGGASFCHKICDEIQNSKNVTKSVTINLPQVEALSSSGLLKDYAAFLVMKARYSNSCVYNFNYTSFGAKFGISRGVAKRLISKFISRGWCKMHSQNLIFNKNSSFYEGKYRLLKQINIDGKNVKEVLYLLRLAIMQNKQHNFNKLKKLRYDLNQAKSAYSYKKDLAFLKRTGKSRDRLPSESSQMKVSIAGFSKLFGCSIGSAHKIVTSFKRNQDALCIVPDQLVINCSNGKMAAAAESLYRNSYYHGGKVFVNQCNRYIF